MATSFSELLTEAGELREIVVSDGHGGKKTIRAIVIWARDTIGKPTVKSGGVLLCDALLSLWADELDRRPRESEFLETPAGVQWEIARVTTSNGVHYLDLNAIRAA